MATLAVALLALGLQSSGAAAPGLQLFNTAVLGQSTPGEVLAVQLTMADDETVRIVYILGRNMRDMTAIVHSSWGEAPHFPWCILRC